MTIYSVYFKTYISIFTLLVCTTLFGQKTRSYTYKNVAITAKILTTKKGKHIHYTASKQSKLPIETLKKNFLNFTNYTKIFEYTEINKVIKKITNTEWIIYQQHNPPWPLPNSHVIFKSKLTNTHKGFIFTTTSTNYNYPLKKYKPLPLINATYTVEKQIDGSLLKIDSEFIPLGNPPAWIFQFWFPKGPVKILENFENIELD